MSDPSYSSILPTGFVSNEDYVIKVTSFIRQYHDLIKASAVDFFLSHDTWNTLKTLFPGIETVIESDDKDWFDTLLNIVEFGKCEVNNYSQISFYYIVMEIFCQYRFIEHSFIHYRILGQNH